MSASFSNFPASTTITNNGDLDEDSDDEIGVRLVKFVQRTEEIHGISEFFTRLIITEIENKLDDVEFFQDILYEEFYYKNRPKHELQDAYTKLINEVYSKIQEDIYLGTLVLPIQIRDDLQKTLLKALEDEYRECILFDISAWTSYYATPKVTKNISSITSEERKVPSITEPAKPATTPEEGLVPEAQLFLELSPQPSADPDSGASTKETIALTQQSASGISSGSLRQDEFAENEIEGFGQGERKRKSHRIWNHLTISRDQTSASDLAHQLLAILGSGKHRERRKMENTTRSVANLAPEQFQQLVQQQKIADNQQIESQQGHQVLAEQAVRLAQLRSEINLRDEPVDSYQKTKISATMVEHPPKEDMLRQDQLLGDSSRSQPGIGLETNTTENLRLSSSDQNEAYDHLLDRIASLEAENQNLKETKKDLAREKVLHFICAENGAPSMAYLAEPDWTIGPKGEILLTAHFPVTDINGYLHSQTEVAFIICKYYSAKHQEDEVQRASKAKQPLPRPQPSSETLTFYSKEMIEAAENFFARQPDFAESFPDFDIRAHIQAPFLFWYHYRGPTALEGLNPAHHALMQLAVTWIEDNYASKYDQVDSQLAKSVVSQETVPFLFKPGDVIVWEKKSELHAAIARSWPKQSSPVRSTQGNTRKNEKDWLKEPQAPDKFTMQWKVDTWKYQYDGKFLKKEQDIEIIYSAQSASEEIGIKKLNAYPLKYATQSFKTTLENRGKMFWNCRIRNVVSYEDAKGIYGVSRMHTILKSLS